MFEVLAAEIKAGLNERGEAVSLQVAGWPARIVQHEMDHLIGRLYTDNMIRSSLALQSLPRFSSSVSYLNPDFTVPYSTTPPLLRASKVPSSGTLSNQTTRGKVSDFHACGRGSILGPGTDLSDLQTLPTPLTRHLVKVWNARSPPWFGFHVKL
uniref:Peptide deformylase n=1 Tax=Timema monikensis TaxID=170555 RepID=A0A7R9E8T8_9NEOP|nr:unnamed protein product [Timema monikensis]